MLPEFDQPGSEGAYVSRLASMYSSSGAIRIIAMSRNSRCRRGLGARGGDAAFFAAARLRGGAASESGRATVCVYLKKIP
jgi:hypothetical protein